MILTAIALVQVVEEVYFRNTFPVLSTIPTRQLLNLPLAEAVAAVLMDLVQQVTAALAKEVRGCHHE